MKKPLWLCVSTICAVLGSFALFSLLLNPPSQSTGFDQLARARDIQGLVRLADAPVNRAETFSFLRGEGAFGVGRHGWRAETMTSPDGKSYVVFTTKMTSQDLSEPVFEVAGGRLKRLVPEEETGGYRARHIDFDLSFRPEARIADIRAKVKFDVAANARPIATLRLGPNYRVKSAVGADGQGMKFSQAGGVVMVSASGTSSITLSYSGVVDSPGYAGAITPQEVMLTNDYWWPMTARSPVTFTTSSRVPATWTVVTSGEEVSNEVSGATRLVKHRMDLPICYLSYSAGEFKHVSKQIGSRSYHVWSRAMSEPDMRLQLELMAPVIEFGSRFAPYPFTRWGAVVSELYGGGALEAYSYATYGTGWLPDEDGHEPAHTWWGGIIPNTYLNSFWNESFAEFCDAQFRRDSGPAPAEERRLAFVQDAETSPAYESATCEASGVTIGGAAVDLGYGKGGLVLQMLEQEIGVDALIGSMRRWIADHPRGEPGEWSGFERAVAAQTGVDLKWFFDQWLRRKGWADFSIENVSYRDGAVIGEVVFKSSPYRLTCDVLAIGRDGSQKFDRVVLCPDGKSTRSAFRLPVSPAPAAVSFDPWHRILRPTSGPKPPRLGSTIRRFKVHVGTGGSQWVGLLNELGIRSQPANGWPSDLANTLVIADPAREPRMADLLARIGITVSGGVIEYGSTRVPLDQGGVLALVDLPAGGRCAVALGSTRLPPRMGNARLVVFDGLGRFLRGVTDPQTVGSLVVRLP